MNYLGYKVAATGHGSGLEPLLDTEIFQLANAPGKLELNSLAWINMREAVKNSSASPRLANAIAWMKPTLPGEEDDLSLWNPKNPKDFVRHTMLPHYIVVGGSHPVAFYFHLKQIDGELQWTLESVSRPFARKGRAEQASPVEE